MEDKKALRNLLRRRRAQKAGASARAASLALRDVFLSGVKLPVRAVVAGYAAQGDEMDPAPLEAVLRAKGHPFCLPCVKTLGEPLVFRLYEPEGPLRGGFRDIPEPFPYSPEIEPDVLLIPLIGFDETCLRLGQGGGLYDRTLAALRARRKIIAIGLAFEAQGLAQLPAEPHDQRLDLIVTEKRIIDPSS